MGTPAVVGHDLLESRDRRALREEIGSQDPHDGLDVGLGDALATVGQRIHEKSLGLTAEANATIVCVELLV